MSRGTSDDVLHSLMICLFKTHLACCLVMLAVFKKSSDLQQIVSKLSDENKDPVFQTWIRPSPEVPKNL